MRAETYQIRELLHMERRYVIPTFQRDYEWTQEGQWELLFEDLVSAAERLARQRHLDSVVGALRGQDDVSPHFLGAIVIDRLVNEAGGLDERTVIDGQQRLTTLHLVARGLLDEAIARDSSRRGQLRRLLRIPDDVVSSEQETHKLRPRRRDRDVWHDVMADDVEPREHRYFDARKFFAAAAREVLASQVEDDELRLDFDTLVDAFLSLFRIVVIELDPNDDAQVIFEVLNGRQTPLSSADLVKNLIFLRAEREVPGSIDQLYDDHWTRFDDEWWREHVGTGHAARRHVDRMLAAWLSAVSSDPAHPDRLYGQVRRHLDAASQKIPPLLEEIGRYAGHYEEFRGRSKASSSTIALAYKSITRTAGDSAQPLVLWLRETLGHLPEHFEASLATVESYLLRRLAVGLNTRGYNNVFHDVLTRSRAESDTSQIPDAVTAALSRLGSSRRWPTDQEVITAFETRRFYGTVAQRNIRLLLGSIDRYMWNQDRRLEDASIDYDALTIEHLMPQSWQSNWPLPSVDGLDPMIQSQEREEHINRMGNLTLISGSLNSSLSNAAWARRRGGLADHSALRLNSHLVSDETYERWGEDEIKGRGRELGGVACLCWPGPETS